MEYLKYCKLLKFNIFCSRFKENNINLHNPIYLGLSQIWKTWKNVNFWPKSGKNYKNQWKSLTVREKSGQTFKNGCSSSNFLIIFSQCIIFSFDELNMNSMCLNSTFLTSNKIYQMSFMHRVIREKVRYIRKVKDLLVA